MAAVGLCLARWAGAVNVPLARPLTEAVKNAQVIVVASVVAAPPVAQPQGPVGQTVDALIQSKAFREAGSYTLSRELVIAGKCEEALKLEMPLLSTQYYAQQKFEAGEGAMVLLLLTADQVPVDARRPMIPVSREGVKKLLAEGKKVDAVDVLLASMKDEALRLILADVLKTVEDARIAPVMRTYADDKNLRTREAVLQCMARNQDVEAIPRIAVLAAEMERTQHASGPVTALGEYHKAEALPYLNPLAVDGTDFLRMNALQALRPLADASSIPFLMKALEKDDAQQSVSYDAYWTLHRLVPALGPTQNRAYFLKHRDAEVQALKQWWEGEQKKAGATQAASGPRP